jgi:RimJ/RimL family protein N-acetyltransferase
MRNGVILRREKKLADIGLIEKWENDLEIRPYFLPNFNEFETHIPVAKSDIIKNIGKYSRTVYMLEFEGETVGYVSYDTGFDEFSVTGERCAWVAIVIGEKNYWNKGIAKIAIFEIEKILASMGIKKIEVGMFSFNERAHLLYKKLGYREIGRNKKFTYAFGSWHEDIRMGKNL